MNDTTKKKASARTAFISHASEDAEIAIQICDYLEQEEIPCWIAPRDVTPGRDFGSEIIDGLEECPVFVLVLSEHANESIYVKREVERAVSAGKPVLPIRVREVMPSRSLELFIASAHWIDAWQPPIRQYLGRLAHAIKVNVGDGHTVPPPKGQSASAQTLSSSRPRSMIPAVIGVVLAMLAVGGWWLYSGGAPAKRIAESPKPVSEREASTPIQVPPTATPDDRKSPPAFESQVASTAPETGSASAERANIDDLMLLLAGTNGAKRFYAVKDLAADLPARLTVDQALTVIGDSSNRRQLLEMLFPRLPTALSMDQAMQLLGPASRTDRYYTIRLIAPRVEKDLKTQDILTLVGDSSNRESAIKMLKH